ncbi:MAG: hypothetical protein AAF658_17395, partial [Myxococcota bacterium]
QQVSWHPEVSWHRWPLALLSGLAHTRGMMPHDLGEPSIEYGLPDETVDGDETPSKAKMVRDIAVFQGKLVVDGLRDGMLMPVTLAAGVLGLVSKNRRATRVFYDILKIGHRTERWINLFHPVAGAEIENALERIRRVRDTLETRGQLDAELEESLDDVEETLENLTNPDFFSYPRR